MLKKLGVSGFLNLENGSIEIEKGKITGKAS